jgi:hypothetical protein
MTIVNFLAGEEKVIGIIASIDTELAEFYLIWFPTTNGIASEPR